MSIERSDTAQGTDAKRPRLGLRLVGLSLLLLLTRLPHAAHPIPVHGDELEFIAGIGFPDAYPVHQPGYPLWVAAGTALSRCGLSGYAAYEAWSIVGSVAAPLLVYLILRRLVSAPLAWWTALAFGVNPLVWFLSCTALTYVSACAAALAIIALLQIALRDRSAAFFNRAAAVMAVAIFLRPDLCLWLGPMFVNAALRIRNRRMTRGIILITAAAALFALVNVGLYGGDAATAPSARHTLDVVLGMSVFRLGLVDGLARNAVKLAAVLGWVVGPPMLVWVLGTILSKDSSRPNTTGRTPAAARRWLALWVLPMLTFVLFIHMSEAGHILLVIPAVYVAIALSLQRRAAAARASRVAAAMALASAVQFSLYPWSPESVGVKRLIDAKVGYISGPGLWQIDRRAEIHRPGDFWPTDAHDGGEVPPKQ